MEITEENMIKTAHQKSDRDHIIEVGHLGEKEGDIIMNTTI